MRIDRNHPRQTYTDFWDWLNQHPVWVINLLLGMLYYLLTTEEI